MLDCLRHKVEESSVRRSTLSSVSELALLMDLSLLILVLDFCILLGEGGWMWRCNAGGGSPGAGRLEPPISVRGAACVCKGILLQATFCFNLQAALQTPLLLISILTIR